MVWPTTLTTDTDLIAYAQVQSVHNLLEPGKNYQMAHEAASDAAKRWLRTSGTDPDKITNQTEYKTPVLNYVLFLAFRVLHPEESDKFLTGFLSEMGMTTPVADPEDANDGGGNYAPIGVYKGSGRDRYGRGGGPWYRRKKNGSSYGGF